MERSATVQEGSGRAEGDGARSGRISERLPLPWLPCLAPGVQRAQLWRQRLCQCRHHEDGEAARLDDSRSHNAVSS